MFYDMKFIWSSFNVLRYEFYYHVDQMKCCLIWIILWIWNKHEIAITVIVFLLVISVIDRKDKLLFNFLTAMLPSKRKGFIFIWIIWTTTLGSFSLGSTWEYSNSNNFFNYYYVSCWFYWGLMTYDKENSSYYYFMS